MLKSSRTNFLAEEVDCGTVINFCTTVAEKMRKILFLILAGK